LNLPVTASRHPRLGGRRTRPHRRASRAADPAGPAGAGDRYRRRCPPSWCRTAARSSAHHDALVEGVHFERRCRRPPTSARRRSPSTSAQNRRDGGAPRYALFVADAAPTTWPWPVCRRPARCLPRHGRPPPASPWRAATSRLPRPLCGRHGRGQRAAQESADARGGGRPGDSVYVTARSVPGRAGLEWLVAHGDANSAPGSARRLRRRGIVVRSHARAFRRAARRNRAASACMDTSDAWRTPLHRSATPADRRNHRPPRRCPSTRARAPWHRAACDAVIAALAGETTTSCSLRCRAEAPAASLVTCSGESQGSTGPGIGELTAESGAAASRAMWRTEPLPTGFVHVLGDVLELPAGQTLAEATCCTPRHAPADRGGLRGGCVLRVFAVSRPAHHLALVVAFAFNLNRVAVLLGCTPKPAVDSARLLQPGRRFWRDDAAGRRSSRIASRN